MSQRTERFYDRFSILYPLVDIFLKPQKKVLFNEVNQLPAGRVLEVGVGDGSHLALYQKHRVVGIDTSEAMLTVARKRGFPDVELLKMDGQTLRFDDASFDYVVLSHVIAVVDDPGQLLQEIGRVLKPGGRLFILNHFTPDNWLGYIDRGFAAFSKMFHFRSVFKMGDIAAIKAFDLLKETGFAPASYFKLLIYSKK